MPEDYKFRSPGAVGPRRPAPSVGQGTNDGDRATAHPADASAPHHSGAGTWVQVVLLLGPWGGRWPKDGPTRTPGRGGGRRGGRCLGVWHCSLLWRSR